MGAIIPRCMPDATKGCPRTIQRRSIFKMSLAGVSWTAMRPVHAWGQNDPASLPPQENDVLIKLGDPAGKPLTVADILTDAQYVSAWPMAPANKVVRSASRLNEVMLVKVDPTQLTGAHLANAAEGVLAYSALCTHAGCNVTTWIPDEGILSCDCHASEFDARAGGNVVGGPASRPLPVLGLKLNGDVLVVAKPFPSAIRFDGF